ncbi:hypothetical protein FACS1894189_4920 [Planctomycetales bacterium]|nr:hypothetical protein FACS1894189_4920 [Planctomycetales bacterium]
MFRRFFFLFVLLLFFGCSSQPNGEVLQTLAEAQSAFDAADYRKAAELYQTLINKGIKSGPLFYNLGNAWANADEPGKAVAAYYSAQRYMPRDPYLAANRQTLLAGSGGSTVENETVLIEHLFFWQNWISSRSKVIISMILMSITFLCGAALCFFRWKWLRRATLALLVLTLIVVCSAGYDWYRFDYVQHAVVIVNGAVPRKGNSEQYEPVFTTPISFGTPTVVFDERKDWVRLRFSSGQDGWLPKEQVVHYD